MGLLVLIKIILLWKIILSEKNKTFFEKVILSEKNKTFFKYIILCEKQTFFKIIKLSENKIKLSSKK